MLLSTSQGGTGKSLLPAQGIITDEVTAVKVTKAVFTPIFGAEEVAKYSPYHARLTEGLWTVYGTLKPGSRGGTSARADQPQTAPGRTNFCVPQKL